MYRVNQQIAGRYCDRANEFGGHGGDRLYRNPPRTDEPLPPLTKEQMGNYRAAADQSIRDAAEFWRRIPGGDFEQQRHPLECCCPSCLLAAQRELHS